MPELDVQVPASREETAASSAQKAHIQQRPQRKGSQQGAPFAGGAGEKGEKARAERRRERRQKGPRQVWIQGTDVHGKPIEEIQIMQDYSRGGFFFVTNLHCYYVGMRLYVIPSFGSLNLEFVAEVVRVEPKPKMAYGVGVQLVRAKDNIAPPKFDPA